MKLPSQIVFGLDIGTRSIVGTVGYRTGEHFHVAAQCIREHETRAMLDGQIHDIHKVGSTINEVKTNLEARIGRPLKDVCIAAAGRVLRTMTTRVECEFAADKEINGEDIYALDSMGVEKAYSEFLESNNSDIKFYCVGYSIIRYYLNGYAISNLEGHKAKVIGADIIATFLPDDVVDGLYKAVGIAGLEVVNLTLEPIAAIQVAIPQMYRMLNMALVDVGAGTSDISVTKDGSIIAYGMIPIAGDALTEVIAKHCLVDFKTAETIKRQAEENETIEYKDIMGLTQTITKKQLLEVAAPVIQDMAKQVSDKIKELNGDKPVSAVFVVGGGGKLEGYTDALAKELGIQEERVAVRGEEVMQQINFYDEDAKKDSLMVTPIGICLSFYEQSNNFIFVYFNEQRVKLYDNNKLAVVDAAMQAEFAHDGLFPKRGKELNYFVNGKPRITRGALGEAAVITVNGQEADIYTTIHANDQIKVIESTAGEPASIDINQLPEYGATMWVEVNEKKVELPEFASVNGSLQSGYYSIQDNDNIEFISYYTVRQIAEFMDVIVNENMNIYVNNKLSDMDTKVYENFSVIWTMEELQLSDRDIYGSGAPDTFANLPEDDGTYVKSEPKKREDPFAAMGAGLENPGNEQDVQQDVQNEQVDSSENMTDVSENGASGEAGTNSGSDREKNAQNPEQNATVNSATGAASNTAANSATGAASNTAANSATGTASNATANSATETASNTATGPAQDNSTASTSTDPTSIQVTVNDDQITLVGKTGYIFVDVFDYIDFDLSTPQGSGIITEINGRNAQYMEPIHNGDVIKIYWKD
ncbi:MAG: rod shape-determining protein [Lachnospiraceae bacterium]|nr:rod shape-determining protein [Lachnospiraceae bacterium]